MRRVLVGLVVLAACLAGESARVPDRDQYPQNVNRVWRDTLYIDSTEAEYSEIYWQAAGTYKTLVVELQDTNSAVLASDSAAIKMELYQVWDIPTSAANVIRLRTTSADTVIDDSLDITECDTTGLVARTAIAITNANGDTTGYTYGTVTGAAVTSGRLAQKYYLVQGDPSPGLTFKVTGKAKNAKRGAGIRVILNLYQMSGDPVKVKEQ